MINFVSGIIAGFIFSTGISLDYLSPTRTVKEVVPSLGSKTHKVSTSSSLLSISDVYAYPHPVPKGEGCHFHYSLSKSAERVSARIYALNGDIVRSFADEHDKEKGEYAIPWNGTDNWGKCVGTGVFLLEVKAEAGKEKDRKLAKFMVWEEKDE
jgi:flagellar hook assembly protein FlgD